MHPWHRHRLNSYTVGRWVTGSQGSYPSTRYRSATRTSPPFRTVRIRSPVAGCCCRSWCSCHANHFRALRDWLDRDPCHPRGGSEAILFLGTSFLCQNQSQAEGMVTHFSMGSKSAFCLNSSRNFRQPALRSLTSDSQ